MRTDVAILGGGNAGYAAALRAAQLGLDVALVEKGKLGGTCLHVGCVPTKALLHSADLVDSIRKAPDFGVTAGTPSVDWAKVLSRKDFVVGKHFKGLTALIKAKKINVIEGEGRLASPDTIEVEGGETVEAGAVVLASGSYARSLPFVDIDGNAFITSDHALSLDGLPKSMIVVGAGAVGLEFASMFASFGAEVTVVEALPRIAPGEDEEVSKEVQRQFEKRKIKVHAGAKVRSAERTDGGAKLVVETAGGKELALEAERCLIAVGRGPVSDGLGYEEAGVKVERGYVVVDELCRTGVDGLWAIGDLITQPDLNLPFPHFQLAHVAFAEGIHVAEQVAGADSYGPVDYAGVPRATYSSPEIASVGLTEAQAEEAGYSVKTAKLPFAAFAKATILGESAGFVKVVSEEGGPVLGVHMVGPRVTELIAEAQVITNWEAYPREVAALIHPHPTLSESLGEALLTLAGTPLHR
ncbi:MAG TPA: dihydrolipoyl dehydrogenase [Actinomycetota bacterium]|nr:dihydrolipoyl dehydrogenase [Actinomycetota bacterium]